MAMTLTAEHRTSSSRLSRHSVTTCTYLCREPVERNVGNADSKAAPPDSFREVPIRIDCIGNESVSECLMIPLLLPR